MVRVNPLLMRVFPLSTSCRSRQIHGPLNILALSLAGFLCCRRRDASPVRGPVHLCCAESVEGGTGATTHARQVSGFCGVVSLLWSVRCAERRHKGLFWGQARLQACVGLCLLYFVTAGLPERIVAGIVARVAEGAGVMFSQTL